MKDHSTRIQRRALPFAVAASFAIHAWPASGASITGLGDLPGGFTDSRAFALSSSGLYAVGSSESGLGLEPFRWNSATGLLGLGNLPGFTAGEANAVSGDGSVVAGYSGTEAFRWTASGGLTSLGHLTVGAQATAYATSSDGNVIVGVDGVQAFRWTLAGGMAALPPLSAGQPAAAIAVSPDGNSAAGTSATQAVRWLGGVATGLGDLSGGAVYSEGYAVSGEGNAAAGFSESANGFEAFRWVEGQGMSGLGDIAGGGFFSIAYGIAPNGQTVVGLGESASGIEAMVWTPVTGMRALWDVLAEQGADLSHWLFLDNAIAVSADGRFIAGSGFNIDGAAEAYVAEITPLGTPAQAPYGGVARALPGRVQAEDYDTGGQLIGAFDTTAGNNGGQYRSDAVDIVTTTDTSGGYNVSAFDAREWLEFTVNASPNPAEQYILRLRVARQSAGNATARVLMGTSSESLTPLTADITVPSTGGAQTWANLEVRNVSLPAGVRILRVQAVTGTFNLNWVEVVRAGIAREVWTGVNGTKVNQIPVNSPPNIRDTLTTIEAPTNWANNYGTRLRGYIKAPTTGNYRFWIASDDNSELWISPSANPAAKVRRANVNGSTNPRQWNKYGSQKSAAIALTAGQFYYVEVLQKEGSGNDNLAVGWSKPGQSTSAPSEVVPNSVLSPYSP